MTTRFENGIVATLGPNNRVIWNGAVVTEDEKIVGIGSAAEMKQRFPSAQVVDCSGKIILQRPIEPEQMRKLLTTGKTDLLHRFISKKGRPFSAFLARGDDGKVSFEFEPRKPKALGAKKGVKVAAEKPTEPSTEPAATPS